MIITPFRKEAGLTVKELAEHIGVSEECIRLWNNGKRIPSVENLHKLRELLGKKLDANLFYGIT